MTWKNTSTEYGSVAKFLHWLIFLLIFAMLTIGFLMDDIGNEVIRAQVFNAHKLVGLSVLLLMILRLIWALTNPKPVLPVGTPRWQKVFERLGHGLIYLALLVMPVAGWVMSSAAGKPPHLFPWVLALPVPVDTSLKETAAFVHYWLAIVIIALISLHVIAALYHHFVKKDNVLLRMMP